MTKTIPIGFLKLKVHMPHPHEHEWAAQLKQGRQHKTLPLLVRKQNISTKLEIKKQIITEHIMQQNLDEAHRAFSELLELRARLCALALEEEKELLGFLSDYHIEQHIDAYDKDCIEFKYTFRTLLNQ